MCFRSGETFINCGETKIIFDIRTRIGNESCPFRFSARALKVAAIELKGDRYTYIYVYIYISIYIVAGLDYCPIN